MTIELPYELERTIRIEAPREAVFKYFTDSSRWAAWWGAGSTIDGTVGGSLLIRYPNAVEAVGTVEEIDPPHRIVFTMGYPSGQPFPPGASRVTITLDAAEDGTVLRLHHATTEASARDLFVQGWRYQLSLFANTVLNAVHADAAARIDAWFEAVSTADLAPRMERMASTAAPGLVYRDAHSCIEGLEEMGPQVDAMHRFMPGFAVRRDGDVAHRQGMAITSWVQSGKDGAPFARGQAVFEFGPAGTIARITLF